MQTLAVFDFDGTITRKDTFIELIRFAHGTPKLLKGLCLFAPILVLMKLHLYPNWRAKERVFTYFFGGMPESDFEALCRRFADSSFEALVHPDAKEAIAHHLDQHHQVAIISASAEQWVKPFAERLQIPVVLATQLAVREGLLTGTFTTANCYGAEKVHRLLARFPEPKDYRLVAYGDSRGDRELLAFADEPHYQSFTL